MEKEVIKLINHGLSYTSIAKKLKIKTIDVINIHKEHIDNQYK